MEISTRRRRDAEFFIFSLRLCASALKTVFNNLQIHIFEMASSCFRVFAIEFGAVCHTRSFFLTSVFRKKTERLFS